MGLQAACEPEPEREWPTHAQICAWYDQVESIEEDTAALTAFWCGQGTQCDDPSNVRMLDDVRMTIALGEHDCTFSESYDPYRPIYGGMVECPDTYAEYWDCWQEAN